MSEQNLCPWCNGKIGEEEQMCDECDSRYGCVPGDDRLYDAFKESLPDGIAEIDVFTDDSVWVWMGEIDRRSNKVRPHREFGFDECEEVE